MSTFDHTGLIQNINTQLGPFRQSQPEAMQGFGQLAKASMAEGEISAKHKELIALAIGVTQRCSGCIGFHVKALNAWAPRARKSKRCWPCASTWAAARPSCTRPRPCRPGTPWPEPGQRARGGVQLRHTSGCESPHPLRRR